MLKINYKIEKVEEGMGRTLDREIGFYIVASCNGKLFYGGKSFLVNIPICINKDGVRTPSMTTDEIEKKIEEEVIRRVIATPSEFESYYKNKVFSVVLD